MGMGQIVDYSQFILQIEKAIANGVASLDSNAKVPKNQISLNASDVGAIAVEADPTVSSFTKGLITNDSILTALNASSGLISSDRLPSYVDDVLSYAAIVNFPVAGETSKIYVAEDTNKIYRWSGSSYVEISSAATADTALKLSTPRTISTTGDATYSVSFDGSANVSSAITLANSGVTAGTYNALSTQVRPFTVDAKGRITGVGTPVDIAPPWSAVTGKPTTLNGYGITDAQPLSNELTAIHSLSDTHQGFIKKTGNGTYEIDNNSYLKLTGGSISGDLNVNGGITVGENFSISYINNFSNISLGNNFNSEYGQSSIEIPTNTLYGGIHQHHTGIKLVCGEMIGWRTAKFKIYVSNDWRKYNPIPCFSVTDAGGTFLGSVKATSFSVGNNQVVSSRRTGWGVPTGTATRTTFATSTVTLSALSERVKALIDDLTAHGLIGA
ncbi:MAG: hypothetical protein ACKPH7_27665 [Planktothrix sp.]|uniref:hypothetical protein n=1 Tax=Planktothrix sp. TaxID=3088171 RepID=UPI0038D4225E